MSRIGKYPVTVPAGSDVKIAGQTVTAKGKLGERSLTIPAVISISRENGEILVKPTDESDRTRMLWGTSRSLLDSLVHGVVNGFTKSLQIVGVGYRAAVQDRVVRLQLGYSHDINYPIPDGIEIVCPTLTSITITGADKQRVGQVTAEIRAFRKPEPYKGKGIRYSDEIVLRKEGKKK